MSDVNQEPQYDVKALAQQLINQGDIIPKGTSIEAVERQINLLIPYAKKYWFYNDKEQFYGFLELGFFPKDIMMDPYFSKIFDSCFNNEDADRKDILNFLHYEIVPKIKRKINGEPLESPDY